MLGTELVCSACHQLDATDRQQCFFSFLFCPGVKLQLPLAHSLLATSAAAKAAAAAAVPVAEEPQPRLSPDSIIVREVNESKVPEIPDDHLEVIGGSMRGDTKGTSK